MLSQLASAAGHRFSETHTADWGDVREGIEHTHSDGVFLRNRKNIETLMWEEDDKQRI